MNCINIKQKMDRTLYCKKRKCQITIKECNSCIYKEFKQYKQLKSNNCQIKNKSRRLAKIERNRFSVFTDNMNKCYLCSSTKNIHIHELIAGRNRINSIKCGFTIPLCDICHSRYQNDVIFNNKWYVLCQKYYEANLGTRDDFIDMFRKSWL